MASNEQVYAAPDVVQTYAKHRGQGLYPGEARLLGSLQWLWDKRVLDIGIGAGRTTAALYPRCQAYTGIDYSPTMVAEALRTLPGVNLACVDARHLPYADESFDLVLFSYNGIDYVDMDDRQMILSEIARVLAPGGVLVFSSHNRDYRWFQATPWAKPWTAQTLSRAWSYLRHSSRRRRTGQYVEKDWARVVDDAHDYRLLTTYVSPYKQEADLRLAGFASEKTFSQDGDTLSSVAQVPDRESCWCYYRAVKP